MSSAALRNLVYAQLSFFSFLVAALLLTDRGFTHNHGLSYYGEHANTIVPYGSGCSAAAFSSGARRLR